MASEVGGENSNHYTTEHPPPPLVFQLQEAGLTYGCQIVDKYIGAVICTADVIVLGPTITSLRLMLKIVNNFG